MLFLLNDIINYIIDNEEIDELLEKVENTYQEVVVMFYNYSKFTISFSYTKNLLLNQENKVALYCIGDEFSVDNCPSSLIYNRHVKNEDEIIYYIMIIITKYRFRGLGYASLLLDEFIELVRNENKYNKEKSIKIVLSSLETSVTFYEKYGFRWTRESLIDHPLLTYYEKYQEGKEYFILELKI
jgi:ribosomal protein S18 acetylase RimI-like enzyme